MFFGHFAANLKLVPEPLLRDYVCWTSRILFEFLAQLIYYSAEVLGFGSVIRSPYSLQDSLVGQRFSLVNYQETQNVKFFRGQMNSIAAYDN